MAMATTTIRTRRHTGEPIMRPLTIIPPLARTDGRKLLTGLMVRLRVELLTIRTPERLRGARRFQLPTAAEVPLKPTIRTQGLTRRRGKARVRRRNGVVPMFRRETRALRWDITQLRMARSRASADRKAERRLLPTRRGAAARPPRQRAATCMPRMTATSIRTPDLGGRVTTTGAGIR